MWARLCSQLDKYSIRNSKLTLPHARQDTVTSQHYAIIGRTLLLRDCPLRSQPLLVLPQGKELQLPPSSGVKLPRIDALAECRQGGAAAVAAAAAVGRVASPQP